MRTRFSSDQVDDNHQSGWYVICGGAIPPMAEMQAMWWCRLLENKVKEGCGGAPSIFRTGMVR